MNCGTVWWVITNSTDFCYTFYGDNILQERICLGGLQGNQLVNCTTLNPDFKCYDPNELPGEYVDAPAYCSPATPTPVCGNGIIDSGEICDDGNTLDGDSCTANCKCKDTDPNNDPAVGGTTTTSSGVFYDQCEINDEKTVLEKSCSPDGSVITTTSTCNFESNCVNQPNTASYCVAYG